MMRRGRPRATVRITTHVPVGVARYLQGRAAEDGLSLSSVTAALLEEAVRLPLDHEHGSLVEAAVGRAVTQAVERVADLAFRAALDSDETRRLVIALLFNALGTERARALRREAHSAAWQRLGEPVPGGPPEDAAARRGTDRRSEMLSDPVLQ